MQSSESVKLLLDLDRQPISNRYLVNLGDEEQLFPLKLGQCQETGLIQLIDPVPYKELVPRFDWVTYKEPEDHLDNLVQRMLLTLPDDKYLNIGGISFKDDTTLSMFLRKGCETWRIDLNEDLSLQSHAGIESIQGALTQKRAEKIVDRYGRVDLLLVRHIWEHVYNHSQFADALKELVLDEGYILFEIPDCTNLLQSIDITMIWEEHLYYFTPFTLKQSLHQCGFEIKTMEVVQYPGENAIIILAKTKYSLHEETDQRRLTAELKAGEQYAKELGVQKLFISEYIKSQNTFGKTVLYGAGHLACAFINYNGLGELISFVVDDNPNKIELFMPQSKIPILSPKQLLGNDISLCLLAMNPINDKKMISNLGELSERGVKIRSIFPSSKYSVFNEKMP